MSHIAVNTKALSQILNRHVERRWSVESNSFGPYVVEQDYGRIVNIEGGSRSGTAEDFERARLIAAAPELLAACRYVAECLTDEYPQLTLKKRLLGAISAACDASPRKGAPA